jgi:hypothetical protein
LFGSFENINIHLKDGHWLVFVTEKGDSDKKVLAVDAVLQSGLDVGWTSVA